MKFRGLANRALKPFGRKLIVAPTGFKFVPLVRRDAIYQHDYGEGG